MIIVLAIVASDGRVRDRASMLVGGGPPMKSVADVGTRMQDLGETAVHVARVWAGEHVYLTIFGVASVMLFTAVLRL
jgi:hypothetical protein